MLTSFLIVLPLFGLIASGYVCARWALLGPTACSELNKFVVYLALPAVLFLVTADSQWATLWQPGFIASFAIGSFAMFAGTVAFRTTRGKPMADSAIDGLNAGYPNAGYIGFPLCDAVFGPKSLALVSIAAILTTSVVFAAAIVTIEIGLQTERRPHYLALKVARALLRNPLLMAPVLGVAWACTGIPLPGAARSLLRLLANAASPCALVSLGLFLAMPHRGGRASRPTALALSVLKLIGQPALTAVCVYGVFHLGALPAAVAGLIAALPTGTGPFMVAEFYRREAVVTSGTILFSTVASVVTLTLCLLLIGHGVP